MPRQSPSRTPRPRDAARTGDAILTAAKQLFTSHGFTHTGVRQVADRAGVNSALVARYFGSKAGLYRAVLERNLNFAPLLQVDRDRFGATLVTAVFDTGDAASPFTMMILSASNPTAQAITRELIQARVMKPLSRWLGAGGTDRAARIAILWAGFLTSWKLLSLLPKQRAQLADTRRWLEAVTQAIVDEAGD
jgi:AcrR family transcriptional regulator